MKYLCLVYTDEAVLGAMSKSEFEVFSDEHVTVDEELRKSGHSVAAEALQPAHTATTVRVRQRQAIDYRRPIHRDQGAVDRVLPHRGKGPERRNPGRREDPGGTGGEHRGQADLESPSA